MKDFNWGGDKLKKIMMSWPFSAPFPKEDDLIEDWPYSIDGMAKITTVNTLARDNKHGYWEVEISASYY